MATGNWQPSTGGGYLGDALSPVSPGGTPDVASWSFTGLAPGFYQVATTWIPTGTASTAAPFTVLDDGVQISETTLNQRDSTPDDFTDAGADWEILDVVWTDGGTLRVDLRDSGRVIADAVRIQAITDPAVDDDFHLRSTFGRFTGALAPVLDPATVLPTLLAVTEIPDLPAELPPGVDRSPAIDRGDAADPFANEPAPSGGYVNIGAYGNTEQAS